MPTLTGVENTEGGAGVVIEGAGLDLVNVR